MKCKVCNKDLIGRQRLFCSKKCKSLLSNNKHQNYIAQQKRGLDRKKELVRIMGGKCKCCGYSKNYAALTFHHRDPSQKETPLDLRQLSNRSWEQIVEESKKCDLMCFNCHMALHHPELETGGP